MPEARTLSSFDNWGGLGFRAAGVVVRVYSLYLADGLATESPTEGSIPHVAVNGSHQLTVFPELLTWLPTAIDRTR